MHFLYEKGKYLQLSDVLEKLFSFCDRLRDRELVTKVENWS